MNTHKEKRGQWNKEYLKNSIEYKFPLFLFVRCPWLHISKGILPYWMLTKFTLILLCNPWYIGCRDAVLGLIPIKNQRKKKRRMRKRSDQMNRKNHKKQDPHFSRHSLKMQVHQWPDMFDAFPPFLYRYYRLGGIGRKQCRKQVVVWDCRSLSVWYF